MHENQVEIGQADVERLVREQFPEWAREPIVPLRTSATTCHIFRIGPRLAARFPMQLADPADLRSSLEAERTALAEFAASSTVPSPTTIAIGQPGSGYPMPWTVQTWIDGDVATPSSAQGSGLLAQDLTELLLQLRAAETRGRRFSGGGRGGDLSVHDEWVEYCLTRSEAMLPVGQVRAAWKTLRATPRASPDVMAHKDLTPANLLVADGRLAGVLDAGGFGPADPALDLVVGWHVLDRGPRELLRSRLSVDDDEWRRGAAWALQQAVGLVWYYEESNPSMSELGRSTLGRILAAPDLTW